MTAAAPSDIYVPLLFFDVKRHFVFADRSGRFSSERISLRLKVTFFRRVCQ